MYVVEMNGVECEVLAGPGVGGGRGTEAMGEAKGKGRKSQQWVSYDVVYGPSAAPREGRGRSRGPAVGSHSQLVPASDKRERDRERGRRSIDSLGHMF